MLELLSFSPLITLNIKNESRVGLENVSWGCFLDASAIPVEGKKDGSDKKDHTQWAELGLAEGAAGL